MTKARWWKPSEWHRAQAMAREGFSANQIGRALSFTAEQVVDRFQNQGIALRGEQRGRVRHIDAQRCRKRRNPEEIFDSRPIDDERDAREEARAMRDLSGRHSFGDPPPGYSALEGKVGMS